MDTKISQIGGLNAILAGMTIGENNGKIEDQLPVSQPQSLTCLQCFVVAHHPHIAYSPGKNNRMLVLQQERPLVIISVGIENYLYREIHRNGLLDYTCAPQNLLS